MLCIAGKNDIAVEIIEYALKFIEKGKICVVTNQNDHGVDRFQRSLLKYAKQNNINIITLEQVYEIKNLIFLSLEFDRIIKPALFKTDKLYNIHFSLLPQYKGMYTSYWPIKNGEIKSGVTLHTIERGIDTGDIIAQERFEITPNMTCKQLYVKYTESGIQLIKDNLDSVIKHTYNQKVQDAFESSYYSKGSLDYSNIEIDLNQTAVNIKNQIRALNFRDYQLPNLFGQNVTHSTITNVKSSMKPGTIINENNLYFQISTIDYDLKIYKDKFEEMLKYCMNGQTKELQQLVDEDYDINEQNEKGWTPLIVASYNGKFEIAELLLEANADINKTNYKGTTPLMYAKDYCIKNNSYMLIKYLLEKGADPFIKDYNNKDIFWHIKNEYGETELFRFKNTIKNQDIN